MYLLKDGLINFTVLSVGNNNVSIIEHVSDVCHFVIIFAKKLCVLKKKRFSIRRENLLEAANPSKIDMKFIVPTLNKKLRSHLIIAC